MSMKENSLYRKTAHPRNSDEPQGWERIEDRGSVDTLNVFDNSELRTPTLIVGYDARGNGDGEIACTITGDHQDRITDYTAIALEGSDNMGEMIVRRLTPKECERLQGYPDDFTNIGEWVDTKGKVHKDADSPRYKALGNSIGLPFWKELLSRISDEYTDRVPTLGSLFDGIGGFPLCWEEKNGKGTAIWASEIEEFPIAVTKIRFPEQEENVDMEELMGLLDLKGE